MTAWQQTNRRRSEENSVSVKCVNTGMCELEGRKHGMIANVPLSAQLTLTEHCHHWQEDKTLHVSNKHAQTK